MVGLGADGVVLVGIPEDQIGVAARGEHALLRIHAEDPRRRRRHQLDETIDGEISLPHAVVVQQLQSVLDARPAVGNLREVVLAQRLLIREAEWAVVRGHDLKVVLLQAFPQLGLVLLLAQRRRKHVLRALPALAFHVVFDGEQQILRAGLGKRRQSAVARFADLIERVFASEMHDINRHAGNLSHRNCAVHGFSLSLGGPRERVINGRRLPLGQRLLHDDVNDGTVLRVHADQRAVLRRLPQRLEDGAVVDHERVGIGHEHLEAGHALAHQVVHIFQARVSQIGHDHVQPVVDARFAFGLLPPCVERVAHFGSARLDREVDDCGGATDRRRARAGLKIVGRF